MLAARRRRDDGSDGLQWGGVATISGVALATSTTEVRLGASTVAVLHPANNAMKHDYKL
jgi:hypothetical protein